MRHVILILLTCLVVACGSAPEMATVQTHSSDSSVLLVDQYRIGVDDSVSVNVWKNPDLSVTVPVRPDGRISVPLVGEVVAGGRTPEEVAAEITMKLSEFVRDPQVAVILVGLNSHEYLSRVRVVGAVQSQISIPFRQGMSVIDVVLEAGGLNDFASGNGAKLIRRTKDQVNTIRVRLEDILQDGNLETNYLVEPGDVISVPERLF